VWLETDLAEEPALTAALAESQGESGDGGVPYPELERDADHGRCYAGRGVPLGNIHWRTHSVKPYADLILGLDHPDAQRLGERVAAKNDPLDRPQRLSSHGHEIDSVSGAGRVRDAEKAFYKPSARGKVIVPPGRDDFTRLERSVALPGRVSEQPGSPVGSYV
jgi:hypothetical protein